MPNVSALNIPPYTNATTVIEALIRRMKEFQEELLREEKLGLNLDEITFYTILANNESAVRELEGAISKKIAMNITANLANQPLSTGR